MTPWIEPNIDGVISISQLAQHTTFAEVPVSLSKCRDYRSVICSER